MQIKCIVLVTIFGISLTSTVFADIWTNTSVISRSLGDCFYPGDLSSIPLNPAGGRFIAGDQVSGSYYMLFDNARYNLLGYGKGDKDFYLSLLLTQLYRNGIEVRESLVDEPIYTYSSKTGFMVSLAKEIANVVVFGVSIKTLYYDIYETKSNYGYGLDIGVYKNFYSGGSVLRNSVNVDVGLSATNLIKPVVSLGDDKEIYNTTYRGSIIVNITLLPRYSFKEEKLYCDTLSLYGNCLDKSYSFGAEYKRDKYSFRAGYKNKNMSLGFGLKWGDIILNYAYVPTADFILHSVDVVYFWGESIQLEKPADEITDFLEIQKKAERLYDRYLKEAEDLIREQKFDSAKQLIEKIMPMKSVLAEKKDTNELWTASVNGCMAQKLSRINNEYASAVSLGLFAEAFDKIISALETAPSETVTKQLISNIRSKTVPQQQMNIIVKTKKEWVSKVINNIWDALRVKDFDQAENELSKLAVLDSNEEYTLKHKSEIETQKKRYADDLVRKGLDFVSQDNYKDAYLYIKEAYRVTKDDTIELQLDAIVDRFSKPDLYDELYQKKMYLLACISYATDDLTKTISTFYELKNINFAYDYNLLEDTLIRIKAIERKLP